MTILKLHTTSTGYGIMYLLRQVEYGGMGVESGEPAVGDVLVGGLGVVDAVPEEVGRWVAAGGCAGQAAR